MKKMKNKDLEEKILKRAQLERNVLSEEIEIQINQIKRMIEFWMNESEEKDIYIYSYITNECIENHLFELKRMISYLSSMQKNLLNERSIKEILFLQSLVKDGKNIR